MFKKALILLAALTITASIFIGCTMQPKSVEETRKVMGVSQAEKFRPDDLRKKGIPWW